MKTLITALISILVLTGAETLLAQGSSAIQADSPTSEIEYSKVTSWGDPDLQGIWSYASLTPLQRPLRLENRAFYTPEEAAEIIASVR